MELLVGLSPGGWDLRTGSREKGRRVVFLARGGEEVKVGALKFSADRTFGKPVLDFEMTGRQVSHSYSRSLQDSMLAYPLV